MGERNWWFMIGPLTEAAAVETNEVIVATLADDVSVHMADEAHWYCTAVAPEAIRDIVSLLRETLASMDRSDDRWLTGMGLLSDMQTWLEDDYRGGA